jgi:hypothetical protein
MNVAVKAKGLLLCGVLILSIFWPQLAHSGTNFKVLQSNLIRDHNGFLHIVGEVINKSDEPKKAITVSASLYDNQGNDIGEFKNIIPVRSLNIGKSSPFDIILLDRNMANQISNYTLTFSGTASEFKKSALSVLSLNSRPDILGFYYINGQVFNHGLESATNSLVIASFYDKNGKILAVTSAMTEPANLSSTSRASFGIVMNDKSQVAKVANYSILVDSDQYIS